jgi:hypothetical protein
MRAAAAGQIRRPEDDASDEAEDLQAVRSDAVGREVDGNEPDPDQGEAEALQEPGEDEAGRLCDHECQTDDHRDGPEHR